MTIWMFGHIAVTEPPHPVNSKVHLTSTSSQNGWWMGLINATSHENHSSSIEFNWFKELQVTSEPLDACVKITLDSFTSVNFKGIFFLPACTFCYTPNVLHMCKVVYRGLEPWVENVCDSTCVFCYPLLRAEDHLCQNKCKKHSKHLIIILAK